ncbi:MAG: hypothetical protein ACFB0B_16770 [Thermonemataceae bacterium]
MRQIEIGEIPLVIKKGLHSYTLGLSVPSVAWKALSDFLHFAFSGVYGHPVQVPSLVEKLQKKEDIYLGLFMLNPVEKQALPEGFLQEVDIKEKKDSPVFYKISIAQEISYVAQQDFIEILLLGEKLKGTTNENSVQKITNNYQNVKNENNIVEKKAGNFTWKDLNTQVSDLKALIEQPASPALVGSITAKRRILHLTLAQEGLLRPEKIDQVLPKLKEQSFETLAHYLAAIHKLHTYLKSEARKAIVGDIPAHSSILDQAISLEWFWQAKTPTGYQDFEWLAYLEEIFKIANPTGAGPLFSRLQGRRVVLQLAYEDGKHLRLMSAAWS